MVMKMKKMTMTKKKDALVCRLSECLHPLHPSFLLPPLWSYILESKRAMAHLLHHLFALNLWTSHDASMSLIHQAILPAWCRHVVGVLCMCKFYAYSCHFFVNWAIRLWYVLHGIEYVQQDCGHCNAYNMCEQQSRDLDWWLYWRTLDGNRLMLVFSSRYGA
jgi:hypothetical protein